MKTHTPGPWFYEKHAQGEHVGTIWGPGSMKVARVYDTTRSGSGDDEVSEANANLLASAPDLLTDRDEWREQHENLLAMYRAAEARIADLTVRLRDLKRAVREGDSPITTGVPAPGDNPAAALAAEPGKGPAAGGVEALREELVGHIRYVHPLPWRVGAKVARNVYDAKSEGVAMFTHAYTAAVVVEAVNRLAPTLPPEGHPRAAEGAAVAYGHDDLACARTEAHLPHFRSGRTGPYCLATREPPRPCECFAARAAEVKNEG